MAWYRTFHGKVVEELGEREGDRARAAHAKSGSRHEGFTWASPGSVARFGKPTHGMSHVHGEQPGAHCGACAVENGMRKHGK